MADAIAVESPRPDLFDRVTVAFKPYKSLKISWHAERRKLDVTVSDYLVDAPDEVIGDIVAAVAASLATRTKFVKPRSYVEFFSDPGFAIKNRDKFFRRDKTCTWAPMGRFRDLRESAERLVDAGLIDWDDIDSAYFTWMIRPSVSVMGFCVHGFRIVAVSPLLDDESVPEDVLDYVVYHECLHLRQAGDTGRVHHTKEFRSWEHAYPGWQDAEETIRVLCKKERLSRDG